MPGRRKPGISQKHGSLPTPKRVYESPALNRAIAFLREAVNRARQEQAPRLPSLHSCASQAGVSFVTMCKAAKHLALQGVITPIRRRGTLLGSIERERVVAKIGAPLHAKEDKWERVRRWIIDDMVSGRIAVDKESLSVKWLADRYNVCFRTAKKALVAADAQLQITKPDLSIARGSRLSPAMVLMMPYSQGASLYQISRDLQSIFRIFEKKCAQNGIAVIVMPMFGPTEEPIPIDRLGIEQLERQRSILGYCLFGSRRQDDGALIARLLKQYKPVAVIDDMGESAKAVLHGTRNLLKSFYLGTGTAAPREVARFLIKQGHARVAFVSSFHNTAWSRVRENEIKKVFAGIGEGYVVESFVCDSERQSAHYLQWQSVANEVNYLCGLFDKSLEAKAQSLNAAIEKRIPLSNHPSRPLFERALSHSGITAWICANDLCAFPALELLARKRIDVPRELSIVSFDDSIDASSMRLTSYNFNLEAIVGAIIQHVISPDRLAIGSRKSPCVEIEGIIVERDTTARPPAASDRKTG